MTRLGLQLYTVKEDAARDFEGTLRQVAAMGYDGVELSDCRVPAAQVAQILADLSLACAGAVVTLDELEHSLSSAMAYAGAIHCSTLVCPWLPPERRTSAAAYCQVAESFNRIGRTLKDHGFRFLYHIHGYEFERLEGRYALDVLLDRCDTDLVSVELDTYWVESAGVNCVELFHRYGARCPYLHFKDMNDKGEKHDVEVGDGVIDIQGMIREAQQFPVEWFIVEQEQFDRPPLESASISLRNLRHLVAAFPASAD
jgi:sugar phosphate isomerase/epimerase